MKRIIAITGLLVINGALGLAQSRIAFEVPFAFTTGNARMAAGQYEILDTGERSNFPVYRLTNVETGRAVALAASWRMSRGEATGAKPELEFRCTSERCAISAVYGSASAAGFGSTVIAPAALSQQEVALIRIPASE